MDIELDFHVESRTDGLWYATERDNYAQWGKGVTIGEAIRDYCDLFLPDTELVDDDDQSIEGRTL